MSQPSPAPVREDAVTAHYLAHVNQYARDTVEGSVEGPLREIAAEPLVTPGKGVRARMLSAVGDVLNVESWKLVPAAAACELLHNASLIHDDVQDGDTVRRGEPTVWARHGVAQAINAGDLLLMNAVTALDTPLYSPELRWSLARACMRRSSATVGGQALELALNKHADIPPSLPLYIRAALGKTGHFFALPVELAALVAGLPEDVAEQLGDAALGLGVVYQIADDLLDLYGDKGRGARGNDIREGKFSVLVAIHLERRPADRAWLVPLLRKDRDETTVSDVERAAAAFIASDAVRLSARRAMDLLDVLRSEPRLADYPAVRHVLESVGAQILRPVSSLLGLLDGAPSTERLAR